MRLNIKRTIVSIIGIMLSTALMLTIGTMFSSIAGTIKNDAIIRNGDYHYSYRFLDPTKVNELIKNVNVDEYYKKRMLGMSSLDVENQYTVSEADNKYLEQLYVTEGVLPKNNNEIIVNDKFLKANNLSIGDEYNFAYGDVHADIKNERIFFNYADYIYDDSHQINYLKTRNYDEIELEVENITEKTYQIVGTFVEPSIWYNYSNFYTLNNEMSDDNAIVYIKYNDPKNAKQYRGETINKYVEKDIFGLDYNRHSKELGNYEELMNYDYIDPSQENYQLMMFYNGFGFENLDSIFLSLLVFILIILSVGSAIVIYNSFAISAIDRKKELGIYKSIGATPSQIKYSILYEAIIVGAIGMFLGVVLSQSVTITLINLVNHYLGDLMSSGEIPVKLGMYINILYFIVPLIFMIIVVYISALIPARNAGKTSAMDLIRQKDDVKLTARAVKSNWFVRKFFKAEGVLAHKNMRRNKKRYRITLISLVTSIIMFVTFSTFAELLERSVETYSQYGYDLQVHMYPNYDYEDRVLISEINNQYKDNVSKMLPLLDDADYLVTKKTYFSVLLNDKVLSDEYQKYLQSFNNGEHYESIVMYAISDDLYQEYAKSINANDAKHIIANQSSIISTKSNNLKLNEYKIFNDKINSIDIIEYVNDNEQVLKIDDVHFTSNVEINNIKLSNSNNSIVLITSDSMFDEYQSRVELDRENVYHEFEYITSEILVRSDNYEMIEKSINDLELDNTYIYSISGEIKLMNNVITLTRIIVYLFILITTLIGVTSVFNTVYTNIVLRRREFAMLRSVGMDTKGFNRILVYESLLFSFKALLLALPISLGLILFLNLILNDVYASSVIFIPYGAIIISIIAVFTIMYLVSMYSSKNIKRENILEALRKELN